MTAVPEIVQKAGGNMKDAQDRTDEISREQGQEKIKEKVSGWYYADLAVAIAVVVGLGATGVSLFWAFSFGKGLVSLAPVAAAIIGATVFVYKDKYQVQLSEPLRIASGIVRGILYTVAAAAFALTYIMRLGDSPVFYNIRREIFSENFADHGEDFLRYIPDKIPKNAEDYEIICSPRFLQAEAHFEISYVTSPEQLEEYRDFAEAKGAIKKDTSEFNYHTSAYEQAEVWSFPSKNGNQNQYIIFPESGYFMACAY